MTDLSACAGGCCIPQEELPTIPVCFQTPESAHFPVHTLPTLSLYVSTSPPRTFTAY